MNHYSPLKKAMLVLGIAVMYFAIPRDFDPYLIGKTLSLGWPHTTAIFFSIIIVGIELTSYAMKYLFQNSRPSITTSIIIIIKELSIFIAIYYSIFILELIVIY
jgi:hypothetical protein